MRLMTLLLLKFITCMIAFGIGLDLFFDASFAHIVSFSVFVTIVSYLLGERVILPQLGKRAAGVADFLLAYLSVWIFGSVLLENYLQIAWGSIISASIITAAEVMIHLFLRRFEKERNLNKNSVFNPALAYATEFGEEEDFENVAKLNQTSEELPKK